MPKPQYAYNPNGNEFNRYDFGISIKKGDFLEDGFEARALFDRMQAGDQSATNEFYNRFGLYVKKYIEKCWPTFKEEHIGDIFDEAWVEIMQAYHLYDPKKGSVANFFSGYIRHAAQTHITKAMKGLTPDRAKKAKELSKIIEEIQLNEGRIPDDIELALLTGWKASDIKKVKMDIYGIQPLSFNDAMETNPSDDDIAKFGVAEDPESAYIKKETLEYFRQAVEALPWAQREVLKRKHGVFGTPAQIDAEIASDIGISVHDIPRLEFLAQKAIRANKSIRNHYYDRAQDIRKDLGNESVLIVPSKAADRMMDDIDEFMDNNEEEATSAFDELEKMAQIKNFNF